MVDSSDRLGHLEWAIESRVSNQRSCLKLLKLFEEYPQKWKTKKFSFAAQDLVAVGFSLWRAAFLAERSGQREAVFSDAKEFLGHVIEDNSIAYAHDKRLREWTFNYYTRTARFTLQNLAAGWPEVVKKYATGTRTPTDRWDYCQELFENAVESFSELLRNQHIRTTKRENELATRADRKQKRKSQRKTVRKLTRSSSK